MSNLIEIKINGAKLSGNLNIPSHAKSLVLFVHGSGSSRLSPRNIYVSKVLNEAGIATLLIDLLSESEDQNHEARFDIPLLTLRVQKIINWIKSNSEISHLHLGLFGASTGAASALLGSIGQNSIKAIVSRGGRPDLAYAHLNEVKAPTLFIVGENDFEVMTLNEQALEKLTCIKEMKIVQGATHLFEEPGCLEKVAKLAKDWFLYYLK